MTIQVGDWVWAPNLPSDIERLYGVSEQVPLSQGFIASFQRTCKHCFVQVAAVHTSQVVLAILAMPVISTHAVIAAQASCAGWTPDTLWPDSKNAFRCELEYFTNVHGTSGRYWAIHMDILMSRNQNPCSEITANDVAVTSARRSKIEDFPHICPLCMNKAYIGFSRVECVSLVCRNYAKRK